MSSYDINDLVEFLPPIARYLPHNILSQGMCQNIYTIYSSHMICQVSLSTRISSESIDFRFGWSKSWFQFSLNFVQRYVYKNPCIKERHIRKVKKRKMTSDDVIEVKCKII